MVEKRNTKNLRKMSEGFRPINVRLKALVGWTYTKTGNQIFLWKLYRHHLLSQERRREVAATSPADTTHLQHIRERDVHSLPSIFLVVSVSNKSVAKLQGCAASRKAGRDNHGLPLRSAVTFTSPVVFGLIFSIRSIVLFTEAASSVPPPRKIDDWWDQ